MKYFYLLLLCFVIHLLSAQEDVTGVWKLKAASWDADTKEYADSDIYKFITPTRWASIFIKPGKGEVTGWAGGTYLRDSDNYVETLEYFSFDSTAVGSQQHFKLFLLGENLIQEGVVKSEKYDYQLYSIYEKVDNLHDSRVSEDFLTGTWKITNAHWGKKKRNEEDIKNIYGEIIKIITPQYYIVSYFDKENKTTKGAVFGKQKIHKSNYEESLIAWTWDPKTTGSKPIYEWSVENGEFTQTGKLNSGKYMDYLIHEVYLRVEPVGESQ